MGALRLIGVYGAAGLLALWLASRFLLPISKRLWLALLLLPLLPTGRAVLTGGYYGPLNIAYASAPLIARSGELPQTKYDNFHLSDVAIQMVPWRKAVRDAVAAGHFPLLNRSILSGDILLASAQSAVFHPATWLGFLLPLSTAWTFSCAFTFFLAALSGFLFLREIGLREGPAFFGAAVWMLSNSLVIRVGWPNSYVFSVLPFLSFGLRRLARGARGGFASTLLALTLMVTGGHPETLLHAVTGAGVLFLFDLRASARPFRAVLRSVGAGALALGLSAASLLPFLEALPQTFDKSFREATFAHAKKSVSAGTSVSTAVALIYPRAYHGVPSEVRRAPPGFLGASYGHVGGLPLGLAALGVFARRREKWGLLAAGLLALLVAIGFPGVTDFVTSLPYYDIAINEYFLCVTVFCVSALAAIGLDRVGEGEGRRLAVPVFTAVLCLILLVGLDWRGSLLAEGIRPLDQDHSILVAFVGMFPFAILLAIPRIPGKWLVGPALALLLIVRMAEVPRLYPTFPSRLFYPEIEEVRRLPATGAPFRVVGLRYNFVPNQSALYGIEDPRGYQAMTNRRYLETYPLWSIPQPVWFNRVDDPTRPFLSFLNVRFALAEPTAPTPDGWREFVRGRHCAIFENPRVLPRAFAPERIRFSTVGTSTVEEMKACPDFSKVGWIEKSHEPAGEAPNGPATVRVSADGPGYSVEVGAARPSWILASFTYWKGWKAFLGDERLPLYFANHAFLGFQVPAGTHRVRLVYRPDSFSLALAISGIAILVIAGLAARQRARRRASGGPPFRADTR